jgi:chromosomal replication initiator protein
MTASNVCDTPDHDGCEGFWLRLRAELQQRVRRDQFDTWFRSVQIERLSQDELDLGVPNGFTRDWLGRHYVEVLRTACHAVDGQPRRIRFTVRAFAEEPQLGEHGHEPELGARDRGPGMPVPDAGGLNRHLNDTLGHGSGHSPSEQDMIQGVNSPRRQTPFYNRGSDIVLNESYRFENFVIGPCNRIAQAASLAVAENPARSYNPLFLHGSVGLGKTHLLQAICHTLLRRHEPLNILYLSCETFINHYIQALQQGNLDSFRYKYRNVDLLLIDDIHFLANKERTQDEFFHTFNALYNAQKQIVLSSDSPPKEIPTLQERLVSRFRWGLVAEIEAPAFETRMAILKRKGRQRGQTLPDEVCQFLAENLASNIRELEGAVAKVIGYATITENPITLELAREATRDLFLVRPSQAVSLQGIIELVSTEYGVSTKDIQSKRRPQSIAMPRQIGMYLARKHTSHSLEEIGGYFGGRDHTTVMYAVQKIKRCLEDNREFRSQVTHLERRLQHQAG